MTTMTMCVIISFLFTSLTIILTTVPYVFLPQQADGRCPNGYHKSPSGDCEQVVPHEGILPRCPNGFHRSPDGDCERIADNNNSNGDNNNNNNDDELSGIPSKNSKDTRSSSFSSSSAGTTTSAPSSPSIVIASESTPGKCDDSLWNHVYNPSRLQIVDKCITVTGIIDSIRTERDGDLHIRLKPDPPHAHLVNQANQENQFGDLVLEPICIGKVTQATAISACQNFHQDIDIPPVSSHVQVTGSYVLDKEHGEWTEIHPVTTMAKKP
jgi:hypothetical protein